MGDGIQAAKAGILEVGDVYVINKADRDGADTLRRDLRSMLALAERGEGDWKPPIVKTIASKNDGLDEVVTEIDRHHAWLEASGELAVRRTTRARDEIEAIALTALRARWGDVHGRSELDDLAQQVAAGESDPYAAAETLLAELRDRAQPAHPRRASTTGWSRPDSMAGDLLLSRMEIPRHGQEARACPRRAVRRFPVVHRPARPRPRDQLQRRSDLGPERADVQVPHQVLPRPVISPVTSPMRSPVRRP
jgi:hypothetical protein